MRKGCKTFLLILAVTAFQNMTNLVNAQDHDGIITVKSCKDFELTGDGSSPAWQGTSWINIPQRTPQKETYNTKAKVLYSETGIYIFFDCQDKKLTSGFTEDNVDLYEGDVVEVFLWPDENFPVYFEYELSPLNYELPIIVPNDKGRFFGWLPWHYEGERKTRHATAVKDGVKENGSAISAWTAEIFIPYKLLTPLPQVPPKSGTRWRANLYRIDYDQGQTLFAWQKINKTYHEYQKFGTFIFE